MKFRQIFFATLALCNFIFAFPDHARAVDPDLDWRVLETAHFKIVYDSRHNELAQRYAVFAEQSFATLAPVFREFPRKTTLVLNDETDAANGFATNVPYPLIMLYPVLPSPLESISDYGNWGLELVTHEYTHTLNIEPSNGIFKPLRWTFGAIMRPNMLLPRWYLEGLAVQIETQYSSFGRLRSANYLAIARAMVDQDTLRNEDISRINETTIPDWPGGARPYLLGALVWNELIQTAGPEAIYTLNHQYSGRLPFTIEGPLEDLTGMTYAELLDKAYTRTEKNANRQIKQVRDAGETKYDRFKQEGSFSYSPAVSPDGKKLIYVSRNHRNDSIVQVVERDGTESFSTRDYKTLLKGDGIQRLAWFPDSKSFVYDKLDEHKRHYEFSDLYVYNFETKKSRQLTRGSRAHEATVSPDGSRIVFVENTPSGTQLSSVDKNGENAKLLYTSSFQGRISKPVFLDDEQIVFTEKIDDGVESLQVFNLETQSKKKIFADLAPVHFPQKTSQGLLFISDRSGIANIFLANNDLTGARPISNIVTRAMTPEFDEQAKEFIYSHLFAEGPQLVRMTLEQSGVAPKQLPQVGSLVDYQWPQHTPPQVDASFEEKDYSVWPYLIPRYWMPWFYLSSTGNFFSASTSAADPLGKHAYDISAFYDSYPDKPGFFGSYINRVTDVTFALGAVDEYDRLTASLLRHNTSASFTAATYLPKLSSNWQAGLGWRYDQTFIATDSPQVRNGPQAFVAYQNYSQRGYEISPETGGAFKTSYTKFLEDLGNMSYERIDLNARYYHSKWLPDRHVITPSFRATIEPGLSSSLLGTSSTSAGQLESTLNVRHLMRGYDPSVFIGRNMLSASLEYRFPVVYSYRGAGTTPLFIKRWHGAVVTDALTTDGLYYDSESEVFRRTRIGGRMFMGAGVEAKADATLGYHLPVTAVLGLYYGFDQQAGTRSAVPFIGFQL